MSKDRRRSLAWKALTLAAGAATSALARSLVTKFWTGTTGGEPPTNPADRRTSWQSAVGWAIAAGAGAGVARVVANRGAAAVWEAAVHEEPPGVRTAA